MTKPYGTIQPAKRDIILTSDIEVEFIAGYGGDWLTVDAARVSTKHSQGSGERIADTAGERGLINGLISHRHKAPVQHGGVTVFVRAPVFVFREWRTHRIAMVQTTDDFAYSEASARYKPLEPVFYVPPPHRPLIDNGGSKMRPSYEVPTPEQHKNLIDILEYAYGTQWAAYESALAMGAAPEIARAVIGTGIYSSMYVSGNPVSWFHFLSLRTHEPDALFVSYPQWEIEQAARILETILAELWPEAYAAFQRNGRFLG